ncbi:unnamed protein product [Rangifer tarandus platyrhynchus]|uniref:Uncharacterized protein n=2 Tax=Rangifer tarandus platyrhynchus TaxID=3082113 RepID=A0ACB0DXT5_RANTA|nr:unnamed protein product [Rangifer tarandus platyrhynchus]CAI9693145.1 unnamed protein product [Rangifer tarandus platyrhynchus]
MDLGKREVASLGQAGQSNSCREGVLQLTRSPRVSYDLATATHSPWDLSPRSRLRRSRAVSGADGCGSGARLRGGPPSACHSTEPLPSCGRLGVLQERPVQAPLSPPSPQSVATFSLVSSPNPKFPHPGFHTGQRVSQAWVHGLWLRPSA